MGLVRAKRSAHHVLRRLLAEEVPHVVACASPQSAALRLIGKVVPSCITMAGWNVLRRL